MRNTWQYKPNQIVRKTTYHIHRHYRRRQYPVLVVIGVTFVVLAILAWLF